MSRRILLTACLLVVGCSSASKGPAVDSGKPCYISGPADDHPVRLDPNVADFLGYTPVPCP